LIVQKLINIVGGKLIAKGNIQATDGITNNSNLEIDGGTLKSNVTGSGTITTKGTSSIDNGVVVSQNLTVSSGELTANTSSLGGTITNNGIINLSGTLSKAISGENGITKVNSNLTIDKDGSVAGTINLNNGTLDLSGDDTATTYNVNHLLGNGNLKVDIDFSDTANIKSDAINISASDDGARTITISDITEISDKTNPFTVDILKGNSDNITLEISEELKSQYNENSREIKDWSAFDYSDDIDFDKTTFDSAEYSTTKQQLIKIVDNKQLKYYDKTLVERHATGNVDSKDALATINSTSGTRSMSATSETSSNAYKLTENLGTTAAGSITVEGKSASELGSLNMNGKKGFEVSNGGTTVNLTNLNITNTANSDGGLINITNSGSSANLTNVTIAENSKNVISSNGTLGVENSTINTGINNTGSLNLSGTNIIVKAFKS